MILTFVAYLVYIKGGAACATETPELRDHHLVSWPPDVTDVTDVTLVTLVSLSLLSCLLCVWPLVLVSEAVSW